MSARIYSADEARDLRESLRSATLSGDDAGTALALTWLRSLTASVEHHAARADAAEKRVAELLADRADAAEVLVTEVERAQIAERRAAELAAQLDAAHTQACGHADDLWEKLSEREEQIAARDEADAKVLRVETTLDPLYILHAVDEVHPGYVSPRTWEFLGAIRSAALARIGGAR